MDRRNFMRNTGAGIFGLSVSSELDSEEIEDQVFGSDDDREERRRSVQLQNRDLRAFFDGSSTGGLPQAVDQTVRLGTGDLTGQVAARPKNPYTFTRSDNPEFVELDDVGMTFGYDFDWYNIDRTYNYPNNDQDVAINWEVFLPYPDGDFMMPVLEIENLSDERLRLDQDEGDIHDGLQLFTDAKMDRFIRDEDSYEFFIPGEGRRNFARRGFPTYRGSNFITVFDEDNAVTYGLLEGDTDPEMTVDDGGDKLDYMVGEITLYPGETAEYETVVALHDGGRYAEDIGERLYGEARNANRRRKREVEREKCD